jgi:hypothetical protein
MALNLGAFAGGVAKGYEQNNEEMRKQKAQERIDKDNANKDAMDAELKASAVARAEAIAANTKVYNGKIAARDNAIEMSKIAPETRLGAANAATSVAPGLSSLITSSVPPTSFAADTAQRSAEGLGSVPVQTPEADPAKTSIMGGLSSADAVNKEMTKPADVYIPPKPTKSEDTVFDYLNHLTERVAIKAKYGQVDEAAQLQLHHAMAKIKSEGVADALKMLNSGQDEEAMKHFQSVGDHRGEKIISSVPGEYSIGGVKVPTRIVQMQGEDGHLYEINTAQAMQATQTASEMVASAQKSAELAMHKEHFERADNTSEDKAKMYYELGNARLAAHGTGGLSDTTADVKNMEYYKKLSPSQQAMFDKLKGRGDSLRADIVTAESRKDEPFGGAKTYAEKSAYIDNMARLVNKNPLEPEVAKPIETTSIMNVLKGVKPANVPESSNNPAKSSSPQNIRLPAQPSQVPTPVQQFQYPAQVQKRSVSEIQKDLSGLREYPSYVNPEVKAAQATKRQQLIRELEDATGLPSSKVQQPLGLGMAFRTGAK